MSPPTAYEAVRSLSMWPSCSLTTLTGSSVLICITVIFVQPSKGPSGTNIWTKAEEALLQRGVARFGANTVMIQTYFLPGKDGRAIESHIARLGLGTTVGQV